LLSVHPPHLLFAFHWADPVSASAVRQQRDSFTAGSLTETHRAHLDGETEEHVLLHRETGEAASAGRGAEWENPVP